jgi:prephenate dehydrogenase
LKIALLGIGLIGGSIGLAARERTGAQVCGYDGDPTVRAHARALGAIDAEATDVAAAVSDADIVFAATPLAALPAVVQAVLAAAPPSCVVSDVGSTKLALAPLAHDQRFIGGHPLAGAETAGVAHARADLFDGATWYLTPTPTTSGVLYERLHRFLVSLGAQPLAIDAPLHDRLMACFSHLPHVLANLLVGQGRALADALGADQQLPAAGPSFRDATRVAGANTAIWRDIYLSNRLPLIEELDTAITRLGEFRALLAAADAAVTDDIDPRVGVDTAVTANAAAAAIAAWNDRARADRQTLLGAGLAGAGGEPVHELRASVPNRPGVIADIALALGHAGVNIVDLALAPSPDNSAGQIALWVRGAGPAARARELIAGLGFPVVTP